MTGRNMLQTQSAVSSPDTEPAMNPIEYRRMYDAEDRHWWYVGLHELVVRCIQAESNQLGRPLAIFDAGCGTGRLCQILKDLGHTVSGCDASKEALRYCSRRGITDVFQADLNTLECEPECYNVITCIDVLYHTGVSNDGTVLKQLHNALKPGGILIVNLVAFEFLRSTHDIAVHTRERYTIPMLKNRLAQAGFRCEQISYRVSLLFPLIAAYRALAALSHSGNKAAENTDSDVVMPHPAINFLLLKSIRLENMLLRFGCFPFGTSVFAIARK